MSDKSDRTQKSPNQKSLQRTKRRLGLAQGNPLNFERLEDRQLLATITVTNSTDFTNADTSSITALMANDGGDGISLREAIVATNNTTGDDTITFDGSVFNGGANSLIRLTQGELEIIETLTIDASTATGVTITGDANGDDVTLPGTFITDVGASFGDTAGAANDLLDDNSRVINFSNAATGTLTLSYLTVTGGRTNEAGENGGGIATDSANVSLVNSTVSGNSTADEFSDGGGISTSSGDVSLVNSTVSRNSTNGRLSGGGGIESSGGDIFLTDSTVSENSTSGYFSQGGGIATRSGNVSLTNSAINGNSTSGNVGGGAGIFTRSGNVSLISSSVNGNSSLGSSSDGGGISTDEGSISLTNSAVSGNSTSGRTSRGGGIATRSGNVSLTYSTVSQNSVGGYLSNGGGIWADDGDVSLINSIVSDNVASGNFGSGGGIATRLGNIFATNSTVSGNSASSSGGGVFSQSVVRIVNSTFTENSAVRYGGGLFLSFFNRVIPRLDIINSIVDGNTDDGTFPEFGLPLGPQGELVVEYSLIGDTTGTGVTSLTGTGNLLNQAAMLGPLADNGGPTLTHALLAGSPAINAGSSMLAVDVEGVALSTDQRGAGFSRIDVGAVDLGSTESNFDNLIAPTVVSVTIDEGGVLARPDLWNRLTVVFDTDVTVAAEDLSLFNAGPRGIAVDVTGVGFSYDSSTNTAIWDFSTLEKAIGPGNHTYRLDASSIASGTLILDGNGDGILGGDFVGDHYVAFAGDPNLDGTVDILNDAFVLVSNLGTTTGAVFADGDFNGDGRVDVLGDAFLLVRNLGRDTQLLSEVVVSNATDLVNGNTGSVFDLVNNDGGDGISLREAIVASNNTVGLGTVTFDGNVFTGGNSSLIRLTQGELLISEELIIDGSSGAEVVISGDANGNDITLPDGFITDADASFGETFGDANDLLADNSRLINFAAERDMLTLSALSLTGGRTTYSGGSSGGAIYSASGDISLLNGVLVSGNSTDGGDFEGGGIFAGFGDVLVNDSVVSGNRTSGGFSNGGGIAADLGNVVLINSTVSGNSTSNGQGGGIYVRSGSVLLTDSVVSGNRVEGGLDDGGGIGTLSGDVTLINSLLSENSTRGTNSNGGGIASNSGSISLINSTLSGNSTSGRSADGGGIFTSSGSISLTNSTLSGNSTSGSDASGGGIKTSEGSVSLINSTLVGNTTSGSRADGGGIYAYRGVVSLSNSTLSGNMTAGVDARGGGVFTDFGNIVLTNSTIDGNSTQGEDAYGGGIYTRYGTVALTNSTLSGNSTSGDGADGGGIFAESGDILVTSSTITGNSAAVAIGGGIAAGFSSVSINNSVLAVNADAGIAPDLQYSSSFSQPIANFSLIGATIETISGVGNQIGTLANPIDPMLGPLADNGGTTLTHALLPGSPAIDAGDDSLTVDAEGLPLVFDQRGESSPRVFGNGVDIGAFELQPVAATPPTIVSATINGGGVLARPDLWNSLTVVFDADVTVAAEDLSLFNDSLGGMEVDLSGIGFSYDPTANTATWDFSAIDPLEAAFYTYRLDATAIVSDGLALDGDWDGTGGDDYVQQHYVAIPGDANLDGVVDVLSDAFALVGNLGSTTKLAWADGNFNGGETVNVLGDAFLLVGNLGGDVRPPVAATSFAKVQSQTTASAIVSLGLSDKGDKRAEVKKASDQITSLSENAELALAGDHELRDDVFGSDF